METLTRDQLKELDYNNADISCKDDDDQGNRYNLLNTLRHRAVYVWTHAP